MWGAAHRAKIEEAPGSVTMLYQLTAHPRIYEQHKQDSTEFSKIKDKKLGGHGSGGRSESRRGKYDPNKIMTFSMNTFKKKKRILSEELAFF